MTSTFLKLPAEMGGMRFGPFQGMVRIGSSQGQVEILLDASFGVAPVHAMLSDAGDGTYMLQPAQAGLGLFVLQQGRSQPTSVGAATKVKPGDTIIVASAAGPRFTIEQEKAPPPRPANAGASRYGQDGFAGAMNREVKRQVWSKLLTRSPFRELYQWGYRYRSGALFQPRYMVGAAAGLFGLAAVSCTGCTGLMGAGAAALFGW